MTNPPSPPRSPRRRVPMKELMQFLLVPIVATVLVVGFIMKPWRTGGIERRNGFELVPLIPKDKNFQPVHKWFGGVSGSVWYTPSGDRLRLQLSARHLTPRLHYILELNVDGTIYAVGSFPANARGRLDVDTTLTTFANGVCVGTNYHPPRSLDGVHLIHFWLKRDGNPASGAQRVDAPGGAPAVTLPCSGNGDHDYDYVLLEQRVARFTGTGAP